MKHLQLFIIISLSIILMLPIRQVEAADCPNVPLSGSYTLTESCSFAINGGDGVDAGSGNANSATVLAPAGMVLTAKPGQPVAFGVLTRTGPGSGFTRGQGASFKKVPIYVPDSDGDGYPTISNANSFAVGGSAVGKVRRSDFGSASGSDLSFTNSANGLPIVLYGDVGNTTTINGTTYIYIVGGTSHFTTVTGPSSAIYKSTINGATGDNGAFSTTSQAQIPAQRNSTDSVIVTVGGTNYMYLLGGVDDNPVTLSTVYKSTINSSGNIGAFATTSQAQLPMITSQSRPVSATINGTSYLYIIGASIGSASTVYKSTIDSSGNIGAFATTSQAQLPFPNTYIRASKPVIHTINGTNYIYVLPGNGSAVYKSTINPSGNIGAFATTSQGQMPVKISRHKAFTGTYNGASYLYVYGGADADTGEIKSTGYKAPIDSSGNVGVFSEIRSLSVPSRAQEVSLVKTNFNNMDTFFVIGGYRGGYAGTSSLNQLSTVYKSVIGSYDCNDGSSSTQKTMSGYVDVDGDGFSPNQEPVDLCGNGAALPSGYSPTNYGYNVGTFTTAGQAQVFGANSGEALLLNQGGTGYIYSFGANSTINNTAIYRATIDSSGNVQGFTTAGQGQMPTDNGHFQSEIINMNGVNYLYLVGGFEGSGFTTVYKSTIDTNGNLSTFTTVGQAQLNENRQSGSLFSYTTQNGSTYMYLLSGEFNLALTRSTVYKATLDSSGNVTTFTTAGQAQFPSNYGRVATYVYPNNGSIYLYVVGGSIGGSTRSTVYRATIDSATGDIQGPFATTSQTQLPITSQYPIITSMGYLPFFSFFRASSSVVYKSNILSTNGNLSSFATTSQGQLLGNPSNTAGGGGIITLGGTTYFYSVGLHGSTLYRADVSLVTGLDNNDNDANTHP